jgi:type VI secretion system protein ImpF
MDNQVGLLPSIIDRLADPSSRGTIARSGYSLEQMARSVQEDLERLLNTRADGEVSAETYPLLAKVLGYGLPDLATLSRLQETDQDGICRILEERIMQYEPRLKDVQVSLKEGETGNPLKIQLHLRAALSVDPAPELLFDTTLDLASGHFMEVK